MKKIFYKIHRSGIIETMWVMVDFLVGKVVSILQVFILNVRGYQIAAGAHIGRNVIVFQSRKFAIHIGERAYVGDGVRIKAGFDGAIHIGKDVYIHDYSFIFAQSGVRVGDNTLISPQVFITDFNHNYSTLGRQEMLKNKNGYRSKPVTIGKNVWIGAHAVILPGITIGDGAIVGAGSVVTKSVAAHTVVAGNPAHIIRIK